MVREGTLCAVKRMGTRAPSSSQARAQFGAGALPSRFEFLGEGADEQRVVVPGFDELEVLEARPALAHRRLAV